MIFQARVSICLYLIALVACSEQPQENGEQPQEDAPGVSTEHYTVGNASKIFDWETVAVLSAARVDHAVVDSETIEALLKTLESFAASNPETKTIKFAADPSSVNTQDALSITFVALEIDGASLLDIIRFSAELAGITFDIRRHEVVFRPAYG